MTAITIFGGTGNTGLCVVSYALELGLIVRLFARNTSTIPDDIKDKVEIYFGDVVNYSDVERAINGTDLVACALGTRSNLGPTTVMSTGTQNIIDAMNKFSLKKSSFVLSSFLFWEPEKVPGIFKEVHADHRRMMEVLRNSSIDYRAVCPPNISNEVVEGFEVAFDKVPGQRFISKFNLGKFMVDCLMDDQFKRRMIGISNCASCN